uniref:Shieldin complex subunit 2 n=1 Tax=Xiphophorus maculatus TaxID=8083 RepID=A0A3B5Q3B9_XIPMA
MKAVLMVQQPGGQQGALLLWGNPGPDQELCSFLPSDAVWDFRVLLVREGLTSDLSELHSTPWSSVRVLDPTDRRALDFLRAWRRPGPSDAALELDLDTDRNGIYTPCYACLPLTALRRFYRPGVLTVSGHGSAHLTVRVPPVPLQKILQAPPDRLQRSAAPGSQMRHVQVAAEKLQALLALPRKWVVITVRSHFLCDQNSVPLSQDFTLMDLQLILVLLFGDLVKNQTSALISISFLLDSPLKRRQL